jgi:hypothetical protein
MQRVGVLALCAIVVLGMVWLLIRTGEPALEGERAGKEAAAAQAATAGGGSAAQGRPADSLARDSSDRDSSDRSPDAAAGAGAAGGGSGIPPREAERGQSAPHDLGAIPTLVAQQPQAPLQPEPELEPEPEPEPELEPADPETDGPVDGSADGERCGKFSLEEIERQVEQAFPDGSLPPEQLAPLRQLEVQRICDQARFADGLVR